MTAASHRGRFRTVAQGDGSLTHSQREQMSSAALHPAELTEAIGGIPDPGVDRVSIDFLADVPGLYSIVVIHYRNGSRYDFTHTSLCDEGDMIAAQGGLPVRRQYLGVEETNTMGDPFGIDMAERTISFWEDSPKGATEHLGW